MNLNCRSLLFMLYTRLKGIAHQLNPRELTALALLIVESTPANKDFMFD